LSTTFRFLFERTCRHFPEPCAPFRCGEVCFYRSATLSSTTFCIFIWKRSCRSILPCGPLSRRGAFLREPQPPVKHFLHLSWKDRVARSVPSGCLVRRGAFLWEPLPPVNLFPGLISKNLPRPFNAFRPNQAANGVSRRTPLRSQHVFRINTADSKKSSQLQSVASRNTRHNAETLVIGGTQSLDDDPGDHLI